MIKLGFWVGLWAAAMSSGSAQVLVEVVQPQDQFLPGEALPVAVRITNDSGQTLHLGGEPDWLTFSVESRNGAVVPKMGEVPVVGPFALPSARVATRRMDLGPCFPISQPGRYNITANLRIKEWGVDVTSPPRAFDVIEGVSLWQVDFGVPKAPGEANGSPEIRRYILQQANYVRGQLRLYLRVTDYTGAKPLRVVLVGRMLSFSRLEHLLDQASNLHLLYQDGPHAYSYFVYNPDGQLLARQTHDYIDTRPRLKVDADGKISVTGGVRRVTASDLPPPKPLVAPEPPKPLNPPAETAVTRP